MKFEDLRVKEICAVFTYKGPKEHIKRWHSENRGWHIVGIKLEGAAKHDFGYKNFVLSRNCVFFFNQRDTYDVEVYESGNTFVVHFTTYEEIDTESFSVSVGSPSEFIAILDKMESMVAKTNRLSLMSQFYKLCSEISSVRDKTYHKTDERISLAREYIDLHFREDSALDGAAEVAGLSRRRFGDLFKNIFDVTPNRYVQIKRIEYSKELLASSELSVGAVASLCGFSDIYYFSKCFKRDVGKTPQNYKKSLHI